MFLRFYAILCDKTAPGLGLRGLCNLRPSDWDYGIRIIIGHAWIGIIRNRIIGPSDWDCSDYRTPGLGLPILVGGYLDARSVRQLAVISVLHAVLR